MVLRLLLLIPLIAALPSLAEAKAANDPTFRVVNRSDQPLVELFATPSGFANWGRNRLNGRVLPPQGSVVLHPPANGNCVYDLRAAFQDYGTDQRRGINVCAVDEVAVGEQTGSGALKSGPDDPSFRLVNRGKVAVASLFATPSGTDHWGENRLRPGGLAPGTAETVRLSRSDGCSFDLRVVLEGGRTLTRRRDDLCRVTDVPVP
jgi:hypothetical protein